jgi:hypothetical protein
MIDKPDERIILTVYNNHVETCGEPPTIDNADRSRYYGYFQNEHGEQWLFVYDYGTETGTLRGGDCGWDRIYEVIGGLAAGLILNSAEQQWLAACWNAATAFKDMRHQ